MTTTLTGERPAGTERPHVQVLADRCAGCQECIVRCPTGALSMDHRRWLAVAYDDRCVGCRQCVRTCPFSAITVAGPLVVEPRVTTAVRHPEPLVGDVSEVRHGLGSWEAALAEAARCLACPDPTCVRGCPAHNDIPTFIAAVSAGDLATAHDALRRTTVLPDICARVCNQAAQCEGACTWALAGGEPVAIGQLERFVTDHLPVPGPRVRAAAADDPTGAAAPVRAASGPGGTPPPGPAPSPDVSVGIVGSGPGGIGAAWWLLEAGASVTVYERDEVPGGLLGWGIPDFTLPDAVAARPWEQLRAAGVDLRCGVAIGAGNLGTLLDRHDAVIVAAGAGTPIRPPIPGADLAGVVDATAFLTSARRALGTPEAAGEWRAGMGLPEPPSPGRVPAPASVLVLGAGNTAMDVARTARRLGLGATCVDWVDERFALARPDELAEARAEGVDIRFGRTVTRLEGTGPRVGRALLARTVQRRATRPPRVLHGEPADVLDTDLVVMAMGYRLDPGYGPLLPDGPVPRRGTGLPDRQWMASGLLAGGDPPAAGRPPVGTQSLGRELGIRAAALPLHDRLWFVGDALVGPSTVVEAMAQGRRAAVAIMAARPSRPGGPRRDRSVRAIVCFTSRSGRTAAIAHRVGDQLQTEGLRVRVLPIEQVGPDELAGADLLVIGTWVEGLVVAGVRPAAAMRTWLSRLPRLAGKPTALFCTYGVHPRRTLDVMSTTVAARGATVVAGATFGRRDDVHAVTRFAAALLPAPCKPATRAGAGEGELAASSAE